MRVLVLLGGDSAERDVSFATGAAVARGLAGRGHAVTGLDPASGRWFEQAELIDLAEHIERHPPPAVEPEAAARQLTASLADTRLEAFDVAFVALHGGRGEDGTVQMLLGLAGLPYTGSGPLASGVAMHKDTTKRLFRQAGVPTPDWIFPVVEGDEVIGRLGLPLVVKPVAEGSTVGVTLLKEPDGLPAALAHAGREPMVERFIPGRELSVGVLDGEALPPVEIVPRHEIYDYECKYTDGMCTYVCPAEVPPDWTERLCALALRTFAVLGCRGYARADFRVTEGGEAYGLEVNTLPGMTSHSLVPRAAAVAGIDFGTLCERICIAAGPRRKGNS